jgi:DNA-binding NtrC family response regulator
VSRDDRLKPRRRAGDGVRCVLEGIRVLFIDDDALARAALVRSIRHARRTWSVLTAADGASALEQLGHHHVDLVVLDLGLPGTSGREVLARLRRQHPEVTVVILTGLDSAAAAIDCTRGGAADYIVKPAAFDTVLARLEAVLPRREFPELIGASLVMQALRERVHRVARSEIPVLIAGETGTGKELVCRALHSASARAAGPLVAINCGALPDSLLDTELFGHERGAFTGAAGIHRGAFEQADGGTLMLDEVGELSPAAQVRLLRVLQERTIRRVGGSAEIRVDPRVVAASHRDLREQVRRGQLREDLYYRLAVCVIEVPALRERVGDVPRLARWFVERHRARINPRVESISDAALDRLARRRFPGNVRELESVVLAALVASDGPILEPGDLPACDAEVVPLDPTVRDRQTLVDAIAMAGGNLTLAARTLGIGRATLYRWLRRDGIHVRREAA